MEEKWSKMKFTGEFPKGLPLLQIVSSIKHPLSDYDVMDPQSSETQGSSCWRGAVRTHWKAVESIFPVQVGGRACEH